jgi:hypothetical protein
MVAPRYAILLPSLLAPSAGQLPVTVPLPSKSPKPLVPLNPTMQLISPSPRPLPRLPAATDSNTLNPLHNNRRRRTATITDCRTPILPWLQLMQQCREDP